MLSAHAISMRWIWTNDARSVPCNNNNNNKNVRFTRTSKVKKSECVCARALQMDFLYIILWACIQWVRRISMGAPSLQWLMFLLCFFLFGRCDRRRMWTQQQRLDFSWNLTLKHKSENRMPEFFPMRVLCTLYTLHFHFQCFELCRSNSFQHIQHSNEYRVAITLWGYAIAACCLFIFHSIVKFVLIFAFSLFSRFCAEPSKLID